MANESTSHTLAEATELTKLRIAHWERHIESLEAIGASTFTSRQFLAGLHDTLQLQRHLQGLTRSYAELAHAKYEELLRIVEQI